MEKLRSNAQLGTSLLASVQEGHGMAGSRQIQIQLHPDGSITGETIGMKGTSCLSALALLEALLDATISDSEFTKEFYESEQDVLSATGSVEGVEVSAHGD